MHQDRSPTELVSGQLRELGEQLGRLVNEHVALAKAELQETVKKTGRDAGLIAVGGLFLALGYGLLLVAVGLGLGELVGRARGFLIVSGVHVFAGLALTLVFSRRLATKDRPAMPSTTATLSEDRRFARRMRAELKAPERQSP